MIIALDKYIEIKNLSDPTKTFERLESEFIDIMYRDHFSANSVIMLLDIGIDPYKEEDILWLRALLEDVLSESGETNVFLAPFTR